MDMQHDYVRRERLYVNEGNFRKVLFEKIHEEGVVFCFKAQTMHSISKKGFCQNFCNGYTPDNGTCMIATNGIMLNNKLAYIILPKDIFSEESEEGVESFVTSIYDSRGIVVYARPIRVKRIYILTYNK